MSSYDRIATAFHARIEGIAGAVDAMAPGIEGGASLLVQAVLEDRKVLVCASGPDGALGELAANLLRRPADGLPALPAVALTRDEDRSVNEGLAHDLRTLSRDGDILLAIDTAQDAPLARICTAVAAERNLALLALSEALELPVEAPMPLLADTRELRRELALMAIHCLQNEIRHLLLGE